MGSVVISGATSGAITLAVPAEAGTRTLTLPATTGTILTNDISAAGDTSAGDAAAVGYTSAEGLILTGQGSTSDVTIKNDADATVLSVATGTGNVGIGKTPTDKSLELYAASNTGFRIQNSTTGTGSGDGFLLEQGGVDTLLVNYEAGVMKFLTSGAERMRIASDGKVLINATSGVGSEKLTVGGSIAATGYQGRIGVSGAYGGNRFNINWTGSPQLYIDNTNIGTFAFTSDYRIKRNIETQTAPALERVMALRPVTYQMADYGTLFKASDDIKEGFIAHEVQEIIPSGAEGVKDNENQIQSLRVDAILAVVVKAMQEQQATIEALEARITALEA